MRVSAATISFRLDSRQKALIERAALTTGQSVTAFAVSHLVRDAEDVLREYQTTVLSARDGQVFLSLLKAHALPNNALRKAVKSYRKQRA